MTVKGTITVGATGILGGAGIASSVFKYSVASAGSLTINGYLDATYIANSGSVVVDNGSLTARDSPAGSETVIALVASGAQVTVKSYLVEDGSEKLTVTDKGLSIGKISSTEYFVGEVPTGSTGNLGPAENNVSLSAGALAKVTGEIVFTESLTNATSNGTKTYTNVLQVTGSITNSTAAAADSSVTTVIMTISKGTAASSVTSSGTTYAFDDTYVAVPADGKLTVAKDVEIDVKGDLQVLGYVDMTAQNTAKKEYIVNTGSITVKGKIKMNGLTVSGSGALDAAMYQTKEGETSVVYNVYSSLSAAVEDILADTNKNTDKTVTIYGDVVVEDSMTIKSPVAVKFATGASLTVGEAGTNDATLTVEDGAKITSAKNQVTVNGTLTFANKDTGDKTVKTVCDVTISSTDSKVIVYTNIYTALGTATAGDVINVTREVIDSDDVVSLYSSITVGEGVTLVVGDSVAPLELKNGVTLYVNGTLQTAQDIQAETQFGTQAMNVTGGTKASAIVVNGTLKTADKFDYTAYYIAGAYYTQDEWNVISALDIAADDLAEISSADITVHGAIVAGDLVFSKGTDDSCKALVVPYESVTVTGSSSDKITTKLTVASLTIDQFELQAYGPVTGTVQNDSAAIELSAVSGTEAAYMSVKDASGKLSIAGTMVIAETASASIAEGTVYTGTLAASGDGYLDVASGAVLEAAGSEVENMSVDGILSVASGKTFTVKGDMIVLGTVNVVAGSSTTAAGTFKVEGLLSVGIDTTYVYTPETTGTASVSGPVTYDSTVVIAAGSSVDDDAMKGLSTKVSTEFYVEDALWITVYAAASTVDIEDFAPYVENAKFNNWTDSLGLPINSAQVGDKGYDEVYADIDYEVYTIVLKADEGVANVYINGNAMVYGLVPYGSTGSDGYYYAYTATVAAGSYEVTYTLKNGYSGTAKLTGDNVSGMKFSVSGDYTAQKVYQLSGIEKSGYVDPVEPEKKDGLTVTDYLLIVLVILVVVLAVIVAMRLMRS